MKDVGKMKIVHVKNTWEETKINALDKMYLCTKFDHNDSIIRRMQRFGS